jgi:molybdopterin converting factor small subunit
MLITVRFYSYFKELTGCAEASQELPSGSSLEDLFRILTTRFPRMAPMNKSTLMAVGVDYQERSYVLRQGEEVSFFPPVQGG